ncbi:MAG: hypothetical protein FD134_707 [Gallionellaceae bacterium]|nr:MAG: hypothetical protein FD134_707 [Gallionellaceae bacterium]
MATLDSNTTPQRAREDRAIYRACSKAACARPALR